MDILCHKHQSAWLLLEKCPKNHPKKVQANLIVSGWTCIWSQVWMCKNIVMALEFMHPREIGRRKSKTIYTKKNIWFVILFERELFRRGALSSPSTSPGFISGWIRLYQWQNGEHRFLNRTKFRDITFSWPHFEQRKACIAFIGRYKGFSRSIW